MSFSLAVSDRGDGTGADGTITGSGGGTVTVQKAIVTASAVGSYSSAGTRSGNGTIALGVGADYFYWRAIEGSATTTAVYQPTSSGGGDSVWERCCVMIKDRIDALGLIGAATIVVTNTILADPNSTDGDADMTITVSQLGQQERMMGGPLQTDDIGYPVLVEFLEPIYNYPTSVGGPDKWRARYIKHRDQCERAINFQRWDYRVPEVWTIAIEPAPAVEADDLKTKRTRFGAFVAVCVARRTRGLT